MKRLIIWLAKKFNVNLVTEKIVIKEVEKQVALEGVIDGDITVKGNLYVAGDIYVAGNISAHGGIVSGMSIEEVKMQAEKEISAYKAMED